MDGRKADHSRSVTQNYKNWQNARPNKSTMTKGNHYVVNIPSKRFGIKTINFFMF